jgi:cholesterol transport system auxiliary component
MIPPLLRWSVAGALVLSLGACVSLLPKSDPVQLYRFGQVVSAEAPGPAVARRVRLVRADGTFQSEAAGDRLLTLTGATAAYLGDSRWVAPADTLFGQAVQAAFDAEPSRAHLISRSEARRTDAVLRIDVRNFETLYISGAKAAPTVLVRIRVSLSAQGEGAAAAERTIAASTRATSPRVTDIVAAYDRSVSVVLGELVTWTNGQIAPGG